jgi:multiple sugar transport system ATP-binding protein
LQGRVELIEALGAETLIYVHTGEGAQLVSRQNARTALQVGDQVSLSLNLTQAHWFDTQGRVVLPV